MSDPSLHAVRCPQCASPLDAAERRRILKCDACGVRLLVRERGGFSRWYLPAKVDRLRAAGIGSGWLKQHPGIQKEARSAVVVEASLLYVPVWEYKALVVGWEYGSRLKTQMVVVGDDKTERLDIELVREKVERPRLGERRFYEAAADLSAIGATRPRITGREAALPLLAGALDDEAFVLEATGFPADIAATGRRAALMPMVDDPREDTRLFPLQETVTLVYYPLWLLRFKTGNRIYEMTVDGRVGTIFSARAPAANAQRLAASIGEMVGLAVIAAGVLAMHSWDRLARAPALVIAVIVSLLIIAAARRFRVHGEVEYHEPYSS
jgi:DNA-directed RNA polymerase subunit RPC12/RpoP